MANELMDKRMNDAELDRVSGGSIKEIYLLETLYEQAGVLTMKGKAGMSRLKEQLSKDLDLIWTCPDDPNSPASCLHWDQVMGNTYWQKVTEGGKTTYRQLSHDQVMSLLGQKYNIGQNEIS